MLRGGRGQAEPGAEDSLARRENFTRWRRNPAAGRATRGGGSMLPFIWVAFGLEARNNTGKLWLTSRWWWSGGGVVVCGHVPRQPTSLPKRARKISIVGHGMRFYGPCSHNCPRPPLPCFGSYWTSNFDAGVRPLDLGEIGISYDVMRRVRQRGIFTRIPSFTKGSL
jgi:hypothetical protein